MGLAGSFMYLHLPANEISRLLIALVCLSALCVARWATQLGNSSSQLLHLALRFNQGSLHSQQDLLEGLCLLRVGTHLGILGCCSGVGSLCLESDAFLHDATHIHGSKLLPQRVNGFVS